jgi:hypothetical protein
MALTRFNAGDGYAHYVGKDGVSIEILPQGTGAASAPHPYKVTVYKDGSTWKAKVYPGSINGQTSTLGGQPLDATPAPTTTISASGYLYLEVTHTDGSAFPVSSEVKFDTTVPTPNTDTKAYIGLAYVEFSGTSAKKMSQLVTTSLWGERLKCGTSTAEYFFAAS